MGKKSFNKKFFPGIGSLAPKKPNPVGEIPLEPELPKPVSPSTDDYTVITLPSAPTLKLPTDPTFEEFVANMEKTHNGASFTMDALIKKEIVMAKAKSKKPAKKADPIFQWTFVSGQEVNGVRAVYTTLLRQDNTLTCNCPGWCFKKKGEKTRFCKHTKKAEEGGEAEKYYKMWKKGEPLPKQELHGGHVVVNSNPVAPSKVGYGRVIELT